jgi:cellulose biosynthesis protein BcsQ
MPAQASGGRTTARRLAIFNHKGGVGKTTLTMNIGATLAGRGRRVLLMDTDPQCNLTSYLVAEDVMDDLLDRSDSDAGATIWSALRPVSEATGAVRLVSPIEPGIENLFLIPGDIRLSEFEVDLNDFWAQSLQRKPRGIRGTTAISDLVSQLCENFGIDYVLYDSGPNIGALNRAILLDCDYFVVPVACDLFSLRALKTLGRTLVDWISQWETIADLAPADMSLLPGTPRFLGYIPEGFKVYAGQVIQAQAGFLSRIDREIHSQIVALLQDVNPALVGDKGRATFKLGEVRHFGALVPASQQQGVPLYEVGGAGSPEQRNDALQALSQIADAIESNVA